jgi:hypothetical protein
MSNQLEEIECCPPFNPALWENKKFSWDNKMFIKDKVFCVFNMPVNFGSVMTRLMKLLENSKANTPDSLCLSEHTSSWNMNLYLAVDKEVEGAQNTSISGSFYSKVYEGSFNKTSEWIKDFETKIKEIGLQHSKLYMWYTTCPKCAKKYGKNYTVIIAMLK